MPLASFLFTSIPTGSVQRPITTMSGYSAMSAVDQQLVPGSRSLHSAVAGPGPAPRFLARRVTSTLAGSVVNSLRTDWWRPRRVLVRRGSRPCWQRGFANAVDQQRHDGCTPRCSETDGVSPAAGRTVTTQMLVPSAGSAAHQPGQRRPPRTVRPSRARTVARRREVSDIGRSRRGVDDGAHQGQNGTRTETR